jgi:hypothetical protein
LQLLIGLYLLVSAEKSLNRLHGELGKLSTTTSKEYKLLRQNMSYEGESIPCPFEGRAQLVKNLEKYDEMLRQGKGIVSPVDDSPQRKFTGLEKNLGEQLSNLVSKINY